MLSVQPRAYRSVSSGADESSGIQVVRTWALDATRHLAVRGRHLSVSRLPDPWSTWILSAVPRGLRLIRSLKPDLIFATCPTPSALVIGAALHRLSGVPWVADFRDPVYDDDDPHVAGGMHATLLRAIERAAIRGSARVLLTAPSARDLYRRRYPEVSESKFVILQNGYDERAFQGIQGQLEPLPGRPLRIVHSGTLYAYARNPMALFDALADLKRSGAVHATRVKFVFRAAGDEAAHRTGIEDRDLGDIVEFAPAVPYREALQEMVRADGLLVLQAANSNYQIPAKLYEYLRAGRPILALTDARGDTADVLRRAKVSSIVDLASTEAIRDAIPRFLGSIVDGTASTPDRDYTLTCDRRNRAHDLARLLETLVP